MGEHLQRIIEKIGDRRAIKAVVMGKATEVTDTSCTVTREDAPELHGVTLNAVYDGALESFVTIVPKEGSDVLAGIIEGQKAEAFIVQCSEVEKVIWKVGDTALTFDAAGWEIKRQNETLKKILADLIKAIRKVTANTNVGPTLIPLINDASFEQLNNRLNDLFSN